MTTDQTAIITPEVPLVFLGVAQRAAKRNQAIDLIGVTHVVSSLFFPSNLDGLVLLFAVPIKRPESYSIHCVDRSPPHRHGGISIKTELQSGPPLLASEDTVGEIEYRDNLTQHSYIVHPDSAALFAVPAPKLSIDRPTDIDIYLECDNIAQRIGRFRLVFQESPPLSDDERRALASRPYTMKELQIQLGCKTCSDSLIVGSVLDRAMGKPQPPVVSVEEAPNEWKCKCGKATVDMQWIKRSLPNLFRYGESLHEGVRPLSVIELYQQGRIRQIHQDFLKLISETTSEETVQKFLEQHSIFWNFLAAQKIIIKPPLGASFRADFAILGADRTLYLVELEKPSTRLVTKKKARCAELQQGLSQIDQWRNRIVRYRDATLTDMRLHPDEVHHIRYILIAGLSGREPPDAMAQVREALKGDTLLYTFDQLAAFVYHIDQSMSKL